MSKSLSSAQLQSLGDSFAKCWSSEKGKRKWSVRGFSYALTSTIFAMGAFFFTDSIPFTQASFDEYASLVAIISPLVATRRNLNFPALSLNHSNFGSGNIDTKESYQKNLLKSASQASSLG